ncbi:MAG: YbaB/EbfC family nucleoid-associated protein [Saprospiraceae bacterium]|nr:YbaB/EbfC family nucleoid-associated protein [Saprospiraceae bacterium]MBP7679755.1 YbaB/EbfC family nucleoid-associated protein [Saprospiraceae bacterium]
MFGDIEAKQKELQQKLTTITVTADAADGAVTVTANAARAIVNISIDTTKIDVSDKEQLEDLLVVAINNALEKAAIKEASESKKLLSDIMPPGLEGMFGGV